MRLDGVVDVLPVFEIFVVVGTVTIFEAIKAYKDQVKCVVYVTSGAVLGTDED